MSKQLELNKLLVKVLDIYCEPFDEPLNGDDVDDIVVHLKNQLNLLNGNITQDEFDKLENPINYFGGKDVEEIEDFETICYVCGKDHLTEGYHIDGIGESYCSKECLLREITQEEFDNWMKILEDNPDDPRAILYWTEWEATK